MFKVTVGSNRKLGSIYGINLPALKTCRDDAPCRRLCYAKRGNFTFHHVASAYEENLRRFMDEPKEAEKDILAQLPLQGHCRIHASGDIPNADYFNMLVRIARKAKGVKFMCFTKRYEMVNNYIAEGKRIPTNLKIIFSGWVGLEMDNPYNLPTAFVSLRHENDDRIKKDAIACSGKCDKCFTCWNMKKGQQVLFHQH